jgi:general stress protein YciG
MQTRDVDSQGNCSKCGGTHFGSTVCTTPPKGKRGFASMDRARQREIAAMGGRAVAPDSRSFSQNRELAKAAGRKGGRAVPPAKRSFSQNRALASEAGRKGGSAVPDEKRSFSRDPELAVQAGRKGGLK